LVAASVSPIRPLRASQRVEVDEVGGSVQPAEPTARQSPIPGPSAAQLQRSTLLPTGS
jgi:hypothetical protein